MATRAMIFIDGSWMYHNKKHIIEAFEEESYDIDYSKIPELVKDHIQNFLHTEIDLIRTSFFASIPKNKPGYNPKKKIAFYDYLTKDCNFDIEIYDIDFRHDPMLKPREKCVDIALASSMLYYAAIPNAFDIAVLVAGDMDYMPLLHRVRSLGKRTLLVGLKGFNQYYPTSKKMAEDTTLYDFPILYLDDHIENIQRKREEMQRQCITCEKEEVTDWTGEEFYCKDCMDQFRKKRVRNCDTCGKEEETAWAEPFYYCYNCRQEYRDKDDMPERNVIQDTIHHY